MVNQPLLPFDASDPDAEPWPDFGQETRLRAAPEWVKLCSREPRLLALEREAAAGTDPGYLVPRLELLVGWYSKTPGLRARKWFDMAFDALGRSHALKRALAAEVMEARHK